MLSPLRSNPYSESSALINAVAVMGTNQALLDISVDCGSDSAGVWRSSGSVCERSARIVSGQDALF